LLVEFGCAAPDPRAGRLPLLRSTVQEAVETTVGMTGRPDLAVGLIRTRDAVDRPVEEGFGLLKNVVEVIATIENVGDALAGETITRFWVRSTSTDIDRELRVVNTPEIPPGDAIEVTALWDLRDGPGSYTITVTADAFSQIDEVRKDNNIAIAHVRVRGTRAELE
jgi:CARDB